MKIIKRVTLAFGAVLLFAVIFFSWRDAEASSLELGYSPTSKDGYALVWTESVGTRWEVGTVLHTDIVKKGVYRAKSNAAFFVERVVRKGKFSLGMGPALWINTNRLIGCKLGYTLSGRYDWTKRFGLTLRHWSNAGTCRPNTGIEFLMIAYKFD